MKRFLPALAVLLTAVTALAAAPADGTTSQDQDVPLLTVVTPYGEEGRDWLEEQLATWAATAGFAVDVIPLPLGEIRQQLLLADEADVQADLLVGVPHDEIGGLVRNSLLADLTAWTTETYRGGLPAAALSAFAGSTGLAGLPLTVSGPALLVNSELVAEVPDSYEEFIADAVRLNRRGSSGFLFDFTNFYFSWAWLKGHGARLSGDAPAGELAPQELTLVSDAAVAGLEALQDLRFRTGLIDDADERAASARLFSEGRLAYAFAGPWTVAEHVAAGVSLEITAIPEAVPGVPFAGFMTVEGVLVSAAAADSAAAVNAAKWLVRPAAQADLALQAGLVPAAPSALADAGEDAALLAGFSRALEHADPVPVSPLLSTVWSVFSDLLATLDGAVHSSSQLEGLLQEAAVELEAGSD